MTRGEHNEVALLKAALSLGEEMLSDHAVNIPSYYQKVYLYKFESKYPAIAKVPSPFLCRERVR